MRNLGIQIEMTQRAQVMTALINLDLLEEFQMTHFNILSLLKIYICFEEFR